MLCFKQHAYRWKFLPVVLKHSYVRAKICKRNSAGGGAEEPGARRKAVARHNKVAEANETECFRMASKHFGDVCRCSLGDGGKANQAARDVLQTAVDIG